MLSTARVTGARKEVETLKKERAALISQRYAAKRNKLLLLLKNTHMTAKEIDFSLEKKVEEVDFRSEIRSLKRRITRVKALASQRTELVLRVKFVLKAKSMEDLEVLIANAESAARVLEKWMEMKLLMMERA
ncbi:hypothetical protein HU200_059583 [Digitaria exilis]|uniref:Uncharacterized protein n=1 Tax=Digitaria exilis TaxID=1010633 RepID=A0A835E172_9POAL|nr:hypothetical protein HU200_059583 [Digitaria exilis]